MGQITDLLDKVTLSSGYGKHSAAALEQLRGFNITGQGNLAPANQDDIGYTFFTRPNLNLSYDNNNYVRRLSFLNEGPLTLGCAIKCFLSPAFPAQRLGGWSASDMPVPVDEARSQIVDDRSAFIEPMSNLIVDLSGFPPMEAEIGSTSEGFRKEVRHYVDSGAHRYGPISLTGQFRNMDGDILRIMTAAWLEYMQQTAQGTIAPYPQMMIEDESDCETTCFRFVMDPTRRWVRKCAQTGYLIPSMVDMGSDFNFSGNAIANEEQITLQFEGSGVFYNDPMTFAIFNRLVAAANPQMLGGVRETALKQIPHEYVELFRGKRTYPYIATNYEFQWWTTAEDYAAVESTLNITLDKE